jgi:hypothetical protein
MTGRAAAKCDRTLDLSVRSFLVSIQKREITTGRVRSCSTGHTQRSVTWRLPYMLPRQQDRMQPSSVRSLSDPVSGQRSTPASLQLLLTRRAGPTEASIRSLTGHSIGEVSYPCSTMPTTKCITFCTCVLAYFHKHFQGC